MGSKRISPGGKNVAAFGARASSPAVAPSPARPHPAVPRTACVSPANRARRDSLPLHRIGDGAAGAASDQQGGLLVARGEGRRRPRGVAVRLSQHRALPSPEVGRASRGATGMGVLRRLRHPPARSARIFRRQSRRVEEDKRAPSLRGQRPFPQTKESRAAPLQLAFDGGSQRPGP